MSFNIEGFARYEADNDPQTFTSFNAADQMNLITNNTDDGDFELNIGETVDLSPGGGDREYVGTINIAGTDAPVFLGAGGDYLVLAPEGSGLVEADFPATIADGDITAQSLLMCFTENTLIQTPQGQIKVCDLKIGDSILTAEGQLTPILWIGVQKVSLRFSQNNERLLPITLTASSLGENIPNEDLTVSNDHAFLVDGILATAGSLVNGSSIYRVPAPELEDDRITYYHIETENHELILANNAPAETFIDNVSRSTFDNFQEYIDLYSSERSMGELPMARAMSPRQLPNAIKEKLARQAQAIGAKRTAA